MRFELPGNVWLQADPNVCHKLSSANHHCGSISWTVRKHFFLCRANIQRLNVYQEADVPCSSFLGLYICVQAVWLSPDMEWGFSLASACSVFWWLTMLCDFCLTTFCFVCCLRVLGQCMCVVCFHDSKPYATVCLFTSFRISSDRTFPMAAKPKNAVDQR